MSSAEYAGRTMMSAAHEEDFPAIAWLHKLLKFFLSGCFTEAERGKGKRGSPDGRRTVICCRADRSELGMRTKGADPKPLGARLFNARRWQNEKLAWSTRTSQLNWSSKTIAVKDEWKPGRGKGGRMTDGGSGLC